MDTAVVQWAAGSVKAFWSPLNFFCFVFEPEVTKFG